MTNERITLTGLSLKLGTPLVIKFDSPLEPGLHPSGWVASFLDTYFRIPVYDSVRNPTPQDALDHLAANIQGKVCTVNLYSRGLPVSTHQLPDSIIGA